MRSRLLVVLALVSALLVGGCGGSSTPSSAATDTSTSSSSSSSSSSSDGSATSSDCPTDNTKAFAKTRFLADVGGAVFLVNRYIVQPYRAGKFTKGASGRTLALIKAAAAAAATAKLLKNAKENAKANPTLCKTIAGPLGQLSDAVGGLTGSLRSGSFDAGILGGLGGLVGSLTSKAAEAGMPVKEQQVPLG